jgi:hypothetical protein
MPIMPDHKIRFAVRAQDGGRSDVWTGWTNIGKGKRDVYLTSKPLGQPMKALGVVKTAPVDTY